MPAKIVSEKNEALAHKARAGDVLASSELINRLSGDVEAMAAVLSEYGIEKADLVQEGMIGLLSAISTYKSGKNASFKTYAKVCISNSMISELRKLSQKGHIPVEKIVSIGENEDVRSVSSPEEDFLEKERLGNLLLAVKGVLSEYEYQVFNMYVSGYSKMEISSFFSKSEKSISNALCRIRCKLKALN